MRRWCIAMAVALGTGPALAETTVTENGGDTYVAGETVTQTLPEMSLSPDAPPPSLARRRGIFTAPVLMSSSISTWPKTPMPPVRPSRSGVR